MYFRKENAKKNCIESNEERHVSYVNSMVDLFFGTIFLRSCVAIGTSFIWIFGELMYTTHDTLVEYLNVNWVVFRFNALI